MTELANVATVFVTYCLAVECRLHHFLLRLRVQDRLSHGVLKGAEIVLGLVFLLVLLVVVPAALDECLQDHGVGGQDVGSDEGEFVGLVVVVGVTGVLHGVLDQLLEC